MSTSPSASASGLPCSEVRISARSSRLAMIRSNHLRRMLERCFAVSLAQAGKARSAACTACVVSAVLMTGTFASSSPFTGLVTGRDGEPTQAPSIKQASRRSDGSLRRSRRVEADCAARAVAVGVMASLLRLFGLGRNIGATDAQCTARNAHQLQANLGAVPLYTAPPLI